MPPTVRRALPAFAWTIERLWALPTPPRDVPIAEVSWLLDLPVWRWRGRRFQVPPSAVLADPTAFAAHLEKAMATDLSFPIHVIRRNGRLVILDGYHRLLKALLLGQSTIKAVEVTRADLSDRG